MRTVKHGVLGFLVIVSTLCANTQAAEKVKFDAYGLAEIWKWVETAPDGKQYLEESGPVLGVGGDLGLGMLDPLWLECGGNVWFGNVDYDGQLQSGKPMKSNTEYLGLNLDADVALKFAMTKELSLKPYVGLGVRVWQRSLDKKAGEMFVGQHGYIENWSMASVILGASADCSLRENAMLFCLVEARIPVVIDENVDMTNFGGSSSIKLKPGKKSSLYLEGGMNISFFKASLFFETMEFSMSPLDDSGQFLQPDSKNTTIGIKGGATF